VGVVRLYAEVKQILEIAVGVYGVIAGRALIQPPLQDFGGAIVARSYSAPGVHGPDARAPFPDSHRQDSCNESTI